MPDFTSNLPKGDNSMIPFLEAMKRAGQSAGQGIGEGMDYLGNQATDLGAGAMDMMQQGGDAVSEAFAAGQRSILESLGMGGGGAVPPEMMMQDGPVNTPPVTGLPEIEPDLNLNPGLPAGMHKYMGRLKGVNI